MANSFGSCVSAAEEPAPASAGTFPPSPSDGHIDVWRLSVAAWSDRLPACRALLSKDEVRRIDRLAFPRDRAIRAVARALLRCILARYLSSHPNRLELAETAYGKPVLARAHRLRFNTSHSGDLVLYAVARDRSVGVDVEAIQRSGPADPALARLVFSAPELDHLESLSPDQRHHAFYRLWTAKEAYVKALGLGLSHSLQGFSVIGGGLSHGRILDVATGRSLAGWQLHALAVGEGYAACLAYEGPPGAMTLRPCPRDTLDEFAYPLT